MSSPRSSLTSSTILLVLAIILTVLSFLSSVEAASKCYLRPRDASPSNPGAGSGTSGGTSSGGGGGTTKTDCGSFMATGWYPGWKGTEDRFAPDKVSWGMYDSVAFAFATSEASGFELDDTSKQVLPDFVKQAHSHNTRALLSLGGWSGSLYFALQVGSAANRSTTLDDIMTLVDKYDLDGIDFDWEFPGHQGAGCNFVHPGDSSNFLSFLQLLRSDQRGKSLYLSAAVATTPFTGADGNRMADVSAFASALDHIGVMVYDIWGPGGSPTVGPNAPLNDTCAGSASERAGSAVSALAAWTGAGFPRDKIVLGVPAYGHSYHVNESVALDGDGGLRLWAKYDLDMQPAGNEDSPNEMRRRALGLGLERRAFGNCTDNGGGGGGGEGRPSGIFDFYGLVEGGFLDEDGKALTDGIAYRFDECSQTPFVYNNTAEVMVSYDDATSFAAKGKFIASQGIKGFAVWDTTGDYNDILLKSIRSNLGCQS